MCCYESGDCCLPRTKAPASREGIRAALLATAPSLLGEAIMGVAIATQADQQIVVSVMWDLVDEGKLLYGTDAWLRPAKLPPAE